MSKHINHNYNCTAVNNDNFPGLSSSVKNQSSMTGEDYGLMKNTKALKSNSNNC